MKLGCCGGLNERKSLKEIGFDFIECPVGMAMDMEEKEIKQLDNNLPFYAFNCFIPGDLKICGEQVDFEKLEEYVTEACRKVNLLGGKRIVFGSGGARRIPDGFPREKAWEQIKEFLKMVAKPAEKYDITIAIEPLNKKETNVLNTLAESIRMAEEVNQPKIIKVLVDLYHLEEENESYEHIRDAGDLLAHIHVADTERLYPGSGNYDYDNLFDILDAINYNKGISIECRWDNKEEEVKKAYNFLNKYV